MQGKVFFKLITFIYLFIYFSLSNGSYSYFKDMRFVQVMLDSQGLSKGSGFVAFSTPEEATKAVCYSYLFFFAGNFSDLHFYHLLSQFAINHFSVKWDEWNDDWTETFVCCCGPTKRGKESLSAGDSCFVYHRYFSLSFFGGKGVYHLIVI